MALLEVEDLVVEFRSDYGDVRASDRVSFTVDKGEVVGLVGESGSGKTVTSKAILRLVEPESAPTVELFARPQHPYTRALIGSLARGTKEEKLLRPIRGEPPHLVHLPPGCAFRPRCDFAVESCAEVQPLRELGSSHLVACHRAPSPA